MTINGKALTLAVALVALLAMPTFAASTVCVSPGGTGSPCYGSITTAMASLGGPTLGAIVKITPGTYYENVVIPPGYDGLQIVGSGKTNTILDAGDNTKLGVTGHTVALIIAARNVTVKAMTIRNGVYGIEVFTKGTIVTGNNFVGSTSAAIFVNPASPFPNYGNTITLNEFHDSTLGVLTQVIGTIVSKNTFTNMATSVVAVADQAQILSNKDYNGVQGPIVVGNAASVKSNDIRYKASLGLLVQGSQPTVQLNKVLGSGIGVLSVCVSCFGGVVSQNSVTDASVVGILAVSDASGLTITSNSVNRAGVGILVPNALNAPDGVFVTLNKVSDTGGTWGDPDVDGQFGNVASGHCIGVTGDNHVVTKNTLKGCGGSGVYVNGSVNTVDSNLITGTFENGITIDGCNFHDPTTSPACNGAPFALNFVTSNKTSLNAGQGIAVVYDADTTFVQLNSATGNQKGAINPLTSLDYCDSNYNSSILLGNSFADPGATVTCYNIH